MADVDFRVSYEVEGNGKDELEKINEQLDETKEVSEGATDGLNATAINIDAVTEVAKKAYQYIAILVSGFINFSNELERNAGILNAFSGDVTVAQQRTNGLIAKIDLITAQSKLMRAGINLSAQDFATLAVAADSFAEQSGRDTVEVLDELSQALITGTDRGFRRYGLELENTTDRTKTQESALSALREEFGNAESQIDSFGGFVSLAQVQMQDLETEFFQLATDASPAVIEQINGLIDALDDATGGFFSSGDASELFRRQIALISAEIAAAVNWITNLIRAVSAFGDMASANLDWITGGGEDARQRSAAALERFENSISQLTPGQVALDVSTGFDNNLDEMDRRRREREERRLRGNRTTTLRTGGQGEGGGEDPTLSIKEEQIARENKILEEQNRLMEEQQELANRRVESLEIERDLYEQLQDTLREQADAGIAAFQSRWNREKAIEDERTALADKVREQTIVDYENSVALADQSSQVILQAFKAGVGPQEVIKAIIEGAEAIGAFARYDYYAGASHLISAAGHTVAAAQAGFSAGSAGRGSAARQAPRNTTPAQRQVSDRMGPMVVNVYGSVYDTSAAFGKELQRVQRRSERRL